MFPVTKGRLPGATEAMNGWRLLVPSTSDPPVTWAVTVAAAIRVVRQDWVWEAVDILLPFDCYLRVSELANLRCEYVADEGDPKLDGTSG
jgi:hypothetical protein